MAPKPGKAATRARKVDFNAGIVHKGKTASEALEDGIRAGDISRSKYDFLNDLTRRFLAGESPTIEEMVRRSQILRELTGLPLPVGSMVFGNNRRFIPEDLHRVHIEDSRGLTSPRRWLRRMINEEERGITGTARKNYHIRVRAMLRDYFGPDFRKLISETIKTRRQRDIFSPEAARPDFRHTFGANPLRRMHGRIILPGGDATMRPRDPEALLRPLFALSPVEVAHFVDGSSMRGEIREALKDLIQSGPAADIARKVMDISAYRPTRINTAYIGHMKGLLFEVLMRERQFDLLADFGRTHKGPGTPLLILGTQARMFDGKLKPSVNMSDGILAVFNGRPFGKNRPPTLDAKQIHEHKSGFSGDIQAYNQTAKWTARLAELGELVIQANALIYRLEGGRVTGPLPFSQILAREGVRPRHRYRMRSDKNEGLVTGAIDQAAWVFGQPAFDAQGGRWDPRARRAKLSLDTVLDPVFLANSERRMTPEQDLIDELVDLAEIEDPKLADKLRRMTPQEAQKMADEDLGGLFPDQVVAPEIMSNLVAEELEYMAIRVLELLAHRMFKSGPGDYLELTPQVLGR